MTAASAARTDAVRTAGPSTRLDSVEDALAALRSGLPVLVVDDEDRENEGDLIMPALTMTDAWMGFFVRHTSGVICAPMPADRAAALQLPPMTAVNEDAKGTAYTVSCDAATGITTGIDAHDRTLTVRTLAADEPDPSTITRPGHVFPLIARDGGVRERPGHTEASVELARLAGLGEVGVIGEVVHDDGTMMRLPALRAFGDEHGLPLISIEELIAHLEAADPAAEAVAGEQADSPEPASGAASDAREGSYDGPVPTEPVALPTPHGTFAMRAWRIGGEEHLSLEAPTPEGATPLVRVHSECLTGDVFGSRRCDCGEQLERSLALVAAHGGAVVYLRGQEGRGIGLFSKVCAYALQDAGADTVDANLDLGLPVDARRYDDAAAILAALGLTELRLLTNNPEKVAALRDAGIGVREQLPLETEPVPENARYLETKRVRLRHSLTDRSAAHAEPAHAQTTPLTAERKAS